MKHQLAIADWNRKDHFHFFNQFDEPFFGVCVRLDCTNAYQFAKSSGESFFLTYLHRSLLAANRIEPFRYRISGDEVWIYDHINASPTINRPDGTFGFGYIDFFEDFQMFKVAAQAEMERVQTGTGLFPATSGENVIHYSAVPWLDFTQISHARSFRFKDSCPKISFGKMTDHGGQKTMPVSIHAHHALMDGLHIGQYIDCFQSLLKED